MEDLNGFMSRLKRTIQTEAISNKDKNLKLEISFDLVETATDEDSYDETIMSVKRALVIPVSTPVPMAKTAHMAESVRGNKGG